MFKREVARRVFAQEFAESNMTFKEGDDQFSPRFLLTPTGAKCGRLFIVGTLIERDEVGSGGMYRAKVTDPTGSFPIFSGQFQKGEDCHLLFTKRSEEVKYHKGEISFPGGVVDEDDSELISTALREAFEEIGLKESDIQTIGLLDDIVTITKFIVTPIVGLFPYPYPFKVSEAEIAELIEVPLSFLLDENCFSESEIFRGGREEVIYNYQYGNHNIWGATARILKQFLDLISSQRSV